MNYGTLVSESWETTWRHRFLWIIGLFAGSSAGAWALGQRGDQVQYQLSPEDLNSLGPELNRELANATNVLGENLALVFAAVAALIVIGLCLAVVSLIAQGGMAWATAELAQGREVASGAAWGAGLRLFWRNLGLWVIVVAVALGIALAIGIVIVVGVAIAAVSIEAIRVTLIILAVLSGISLALVAIPVGIAASVVVAYAQRAIAVEDLGPMGGLAAGWRVFRGNPGTSLVVWLLSTGLSIGAGIAFFLAMAVVVVALGAVGALVWFAASGFWPAVVAYVAVAVLLAFAALCWLAAVMNTYFWSYWTTAYLRMTGRMVDATA